MRGDCSAPLPRLHEQQASYKYGTCPCHMLSPRVLSSQDHAGGCCTPLYIPADRKCTILAWHARSTFAKDSIQNCAKGSTLSNLPQGGGGSGHGFGAAWDICPQLMVPRQARLLTRLQVPRAKLVAKGCTHADKRQLPDRALLFMHSKPRIKVPGPPVQTSCPTAAQDWGKMMRAWSVRSSNLARLSSSACGWLTMFSNATSRSQMACRHVLRRGVIVNKMPDRCNSSRSDVVHLTSRAPA